MAKSRVILIQGLPLSYHVAEENTFLRTRMDVFPSHYAGDDREEVRERMHVAHYKKAGAESEGLLQKLAGGRWLLSTQGVTEVRGKGTGEVIQVHRRCWYLSAHLLESNVYV